MISSYGGILYHEYDSTSTSTDIGISPTDSSYIVSYAGCSDATSEGTPKSVDVSCSAGVPVLDCEEEEPEKVSKLPKKELRSMKPSKRRKPEITSPPGGWFFFKG